MSEQSLGLIETLGLTTAVAAADAAMKSANVTLVGYEFAKGDGMTMVKLRGDVGAVKAAIAAAEAAAGRVGRVVATRVIARPARGLALIVDSQETVGLAKAESGDAPAEVTPPQAPVQEALTLSETPDAGVTETPVPPAAEVPATALEETPAPEPTAEVDPEITPEPVVETAAPEAETPAPEAVSEPAPVSSPEAAQEPEPKAEPAPKPAAKPTHSGRPGRGPKRR
ncbi:BMC domain-containing protein [Rhodobacter aestuarii]|uniref:BMC domain-containing protein n=1 Tax=Rhodobacter aestuarii TaxID=453582 RepID=A0A1N7Q0N6_9RHOB|nr:BMC domain-containing protein [Rhodobacter aestuarii]PTV93985.1 BMC domain-containing protein [Rhodobacter aestuarii]SIT16167.1 BMC domain-containing protein [Rhodobacter aestuarii]